MKKITVDGVVYVQESDIPKADIPQVDASNPYFVVGKEYFIRTVTNYFTGRLVWVGDKEIALEDVAWIADTGRFNEFLAGKTVDEVEPYPKVVVVVGRGAIIDMSERVSGLLLSVK